VSPEMTSSSPSGAARHPARLTGVSETALMTLNSRAREARRPDALIDDPMAVRLVDSIDYDFTRFGRTRQDMPLRAKAYDIATRHYLSTYPDATVVALAEGLQTSFWRLQDSVADARFRWLTVDFDPVIDIRARLLPHSPRISMVAQSALDFTWMDGVDSSAGVFVTAEGLLMYLQPEQALGLIAACAKRFPGGQMIFDLPPSWLGGLSRRGWLRPSLRYRVPPMPFSLTVDQATRLTDTVPGIRAVHHLELPLGRGTLFNATLRTVNRHRRLAGLRGLLTLLEFG
jgi:O-methyltransferase involved in polyketide biosynthesis